MSKPLDRLFELLDLKVRDWEQDWDLIHADPDRIEQFCDVYESESFNRVEKNELMRLIVGSYDRMLEEGRESNAIWERINRLLRRDFSTHRETVEYWSLLEETDASNVFPITPLMREVWHDCNSGAT